ncbi:MAG: cell envelope integrity protein TolA, partial [Methylobacter sp.]
MDSQKKRFSWPFILALTLHITILALFAVSSLFDFTQKESVPAQEIINATIVDETQGQTESEPEAAKPEPATPDEQLAEEKIKQQAEADLKAEQALHQAEAEKAEAEAKQA